MANINIKYTNKPIIAYRIIYKILINLLVDVNGIKYLTLTSTTTIAIVIKIILITFFKVSS